ncbi:hypothetical protein ABMA28_009834 [Loxostege sticticalis]|uniref:Uncharacterized protein n=1 Tax=Loxostege sticticalis TaxID=481309 RepID=A0ABD0SBK0_LOXSC
MMWYMKYLALASILFNVQATPNFLHDGSNLVCVSDDDADFVLKKGVLSDTSDTKSITLKSCGITRVKCEAFHGLPAVKSLVLSENRIHKLDPCMLNGLDQLTHLDISFNRIEEIPTGFFDAVDDIEELYLQGNKLRTIKTGVFDKLIKLTHLNLAYNELRGVELKSHIFDNTKQLKYLNLTKNYFLEAPDNLLASLPSLLVLNLDKCVLTEVPSFAMRDNLKTLKNLSLTTNFISNLDNPTTFVNMDDLEVLDLNGNSIESVHENVFAPLKKVKTIYLRRNRLIKIPDKLFQNLPKLVNVDLAFNAIEKIQVTPFKNSPMKNLNLSGNRLTYLPENFCQQLINEGGRLKKFLFSHNPWQCGCLRDIIEEAKSLGLVYNRDKYSGNDAVCVSGTQFGCVRN